MNAAQARVPEVHGARAWALLGAPPLVHRYGDVIPFRVKNKCGVVATLVETKRVVAAPSNLGGCPAPTPGLRQSRMRALPRWRIPTGVLNRAFQKRRRDPTYEAGLDRPATGVAAPTKRNAEVPR